jgi:GNAT superfamily N-acetyltransferase
MILTADVRRSARVMQVEGMFDVPPARSQKFEVHVPALLTDMAAGQDYDHPWSVGLIVGPSGSGKSTVARRLRDHAPEDVTYVPPAGLDWPDEALIDAMPGGVRDAVSILTAVGFGSPPSWLRPFHTLSTGEQFRASMARAIAEQGQGSTLIVDEFTSVVDRQVAQVGSHAIQKTIRRGRSRFIAVTCHFDVIDWLQPDWVYRPDTVDFEWRRLQRHPAIKLDVCEVGREAWEVFRRHHYLSGDLHVAAKCVAAFAPDGQPVAFNARYKFPHPKAKDIWMSHRTVVFPDWQGLGIGERLTSHVGEQLARSGQRLRATLAHPALINARRSSPRWREVGGANTLSASRKPKRLQKQHQSVRKLATRSFEYVPVR